MKDLKKLYELDIPAVQIKAVRKIDIEKVEKNGKI